MKKLITIALLAAMLLSCFAGCGLKQGSVNAVVDAENVSAPTTRPATEDKWSGTAEIPALAAEADAKLTINADDPTQNTTTVEGFTDADLTWFDPDKAVETEGEYKDKQVYEMSSAADFVGFMLLRAAAASYNNFEGKVFKLTVNVDLNGINIAPTGNITFAGVLDGGDHAVSNYTITYAVAKSNRGLFYELSGSGAIKNISFFDTTLTLANKRSTGYYNFSGLVVTVDTTDAPEGHVSLENVYYDGNTKWGSKVSGELRTIGGLVGTVTGNGTTIIKNCTYAGDMNLSHETTTTAGKNSGGLVATVAKGGLIMENCHFTGSVTSNAGDAVGGLIGLVQDAAGTIVLVNCTSTGTVTTAGTNGKYVGSVAEGVKVWGAGATSAAWDGNPDTEWNTAEGDAEIADAADLAQFVAMINAGKTFAGKTITLTANINLGGNAWTPGKADFAGTFDGGNHVISNYTLTQSGTSGFFCNLAAGATFKDVALIGGAYTANANYMGIAFGKATGGETAINVQNIYYDVTITATADQNGCGLFGSCTGSGTVNISNLEANGTVDSTTKSIGRFGAAHGDSASNAIVNISNSINNVDYNGKGTYVGGFVGRFNSAGKLTVTNCLNTGDYVAGEGVGGLIGYQQTGSVEIYNCKNEGDLSAVTRVGGLIGGQRPGASYSKSTIISDSVNTGALTFQTGENWGIGSIIGGGLTDEGGSATGVLTLINCPVVSTATIPMVGGNKANVEVVGYQTTTPVEGVYNLRYVATFNPGAAEMCAGFIVTVKYTEDGTTISTKVDAQEVWAKTAYTSINGGGNIYTAAEFGAEYLYTLEIQNVPEGYTVDNGKLEVTITPFTSADLTEKTASYTVVDGAVVINAAA